MPYEVVTVDTTTGPEDIVVDTDASGNRYQVMRLDLGADTGVQPVTGTVPVSASSLPLPSGAATSAAQTTGNASLATIAGAVSGGQFQVDVVSGSAAGTEYLEGDVDATISGVAAMWEDASNTLRPVSATTPLPVRLIAGQTGVDGNTGTVSAATQRVVLATNVGLPAGSAALGSVTLGTGTAAYVGKFRLTDGTVDAALFDLTNSNPLPVAIVDTAGTQVGLPPPKVISVSPTVDTSAYAIGDVLFTATAFADAAGASGGTGDLLRITVVDKDSEGPTLDLYICSATISLTRNVAYASAVADGDALKILEKLSIPAASWETHGAFKRYTFGVGDGLPLAYHCAANTSLYIFGVTQTAFTYTSASDLAIEIQVQPA